MNKDYCILHVEDNETNRYVMRHFLKRYEVNLLEAETGEEGLVMALREKPDLILLDIRLPGIQGTDVLKQLEQNPETKDIPVVAVSSGAFETDIEAAIAHGFVDYIVKPVDINRLQQMVKMYMLKKEAGREK